MALESLSSSAYTDTQVLVRQKSMIISSVLHLTFKFKSFVSHPVDKGLQLTSAGQVIAVRYEANEGRVESHKKLRLNHHQFLTQKPQSCIIYSCDPARTQIIIAVPGDEYK